MPCHPYDRCRAPSQWKQRRARSRSVRHGLHAAKLSYDFTGTEGTSAVYMNFRDAVGAAGRPIEGYPKTIGLWVYGDGNNHWLRA
ncbi:hypothetical protein [Paenibacillus apiarius]|uniref:hypothetical protein n=1 Tax=Paenibacillus apiarius TaxID=46240 RepID=UPI001F08C8C2|nr:hypothetical protein [Paenibacillus apiarius]